MKTITIELREKDYCPLIIKDSEADITEITGSGNIYHAVFGAICYATGDKKTIDRFERMQKVDSEFVAEIIANAFNEAKKTTNYIFDNFYKKKK